MKVIFMGTPDFSCPTLEKLINDKNIQIAAIYTREPQIAGRGHKVTNSPVHNLALKHNLKVITPKTLKSEEIKQQFIDFGADVAVVVAYGLLLPQAILQAPKLGCINIHPSLLPRWRGAAPIQRTIMAGDKKTGITIMKMDQGLDSGDIIYQEEFALDDKINYQQLADKFAVLGANALLKTLKNMEQGNYQLTKQDHNLANYAQKITKEEALIDWNKSAQEVNNKIRGLSGNIGSYFIYNNQRIKILEAEVIPLPENKKGLKAGQIIEDEFIIICKTQAIRPLIIQKEGKKKMTTQEFLRGFK